MSSRLQQIISQQFPTPARGGSSGGLGGVDGGGAGGLDRRGAGAPHASGSGTQPGAAGPRVGADGDRSSHPRAVPEKVKPRWAQRSEKAGPQMSAKRILLVDDDPLVREYGEQVLTERGYEVVTAENGQEGLAYLLGQPFDGAVIDLKMPDLDGSELLRQIRARGLSVPVWIMTGYGSFDSCMECTRLGVQGFLPKPFSMMDLALLIEQTLSRDFAAAATGTTPSSRQASPTEPSPEGRQPLTPREKEILWYLRHGLTDTEIARKLFLSEHTVRNHVRHIVQKLRVKNRVEAVALSFQQDLFRP